MLALKQLSVGYPGTRGIVLEDVEIGVEPGAFVSILGRNGAGKTTLMRTIAGLLSPMRGYAALDGDVVDDMAASARARQVAVVVTERAFSPGLRVEDVVSLGRQPFTGWRGRLTPDDHQIVDEAIDRVDASNFRGRFVADLSDGERQRVMVARAIAQSAGLLVLDEITAFLDLPGRVEIMAILRDHARSSGAIVLLSSHDLDLSLQLSDSIWLVADGRVESGEAKALTSSGAIGRAFNSSRVNYCTHERRFTLVERDMVENGR